MDSDSSGLNRSEMFMDRSAERESCRRSPPYMRKLGFRFGVDYVPLQCGGRSRSVTPTQRISRASVLAVNHHKHQAGFRCLLTGDEVLQMVQRHIDGQDVGQLNMIQLIQPEKQLDFGCGRAEQGIMQSEIFQCDMSGMFLSTPISS